MHACRSDKNFECIIFLQVNIAKLAYSPKEYGGELYRLSVSCLTQMPPRSGCLFFKVIGQNLVNNINNITNGIDNYD